jgi:hypothetical protein
MKKIVYFSAIIVCYFIVVSYSSGDANHNQQDCTGAETGWGSFTGCQNGCHAPTATAGIGIKIQLIDSTNVPVNYYKGGSDYTIQLKGVNNTNTSLPKFGFQITAIVGDSTKDFPVNAGTWISPNPANMNCFFSDSTQYMAPQATYYSLGLVEQSRAIHASSGNGGNGTTYVRTLKWRAPSAGTGSVSLWAVLNAVNGDASADPGDLWDTTHVIIYEFGHQPLSVVSLDADKIQINIFPIPTSKELTIIYSLEKESEVSIQLIDMRGEFIADLLNEKQSMGLKVIDTFIPPNLQEGMYLLRVTINDKQFIKKVVVNY